AHWRKLLKTSLWKQCTSTSSEPTTNSEFRKLTSEYLQKNLAQHQLGTKLLSTCHNKCQIDPILWLPMSFSEHSRMIRWRLEWLPGGLPLTIPCHNSSQHARPSVRPYHHP
ncbi:hypothetical protein BDF20DRAFT_926102, partial [Mycotypha africana]|uniref:uncharacterized protein n=1 Tax=Mycotypha africana TaxID=64632 RepID=UPI002300375A